MRKPEAKYKYLINEEKFDPKVRDAVSKKSISHKDALTINSIQEMMAKERMARQGMQEGDGSDHNSGRNDSVIYEHKRNK